MFCGGVGWWVWVWVGLFGRTHSVYELRWLGWEQMGYGHKTSVRALLATGNEVGCSCHVVSILKQSQRKQCPRKEALRGAPRNPSLCP